MTSVKELFILLATGEFSNIALKRDDSGELDESEYEKVIGHINLGLTEIYKRFHFLSKELTLYITPTNETYYIQANRVAALEAIDADHYILKPDDWDETTSTINLVEIKEVFDSDGEPLKINNRFATPAIQQRSMDKLKITGVEEATTISILYQAYLDKLVLNDSFDPEAEEIDIPRAAVEALLYYVAMRVYKPIGKNDSTANADKSSGYQAQFELSCQRIELLGLDIQDEDVDDDKFQEEGWA